MSRWTLLKVLAKIRNRPFLSTGSSQFLPNSSAISYAFGRRQCLAGRRDVCTGFLPEGCVEVFINNEPPVVVGLWTGPLWVKFSAGTLFVALRSGKTWNRS
jgi:hypothetical protein